MNVQDMLADRQAALLQSRRQISIGKNPHDVTLTGQHQHQQHQQCPVVPTNNGNYAAGQPPLATRAAPPPPTAANQNVYLGAELQTQTQLAPTNPSANENAIGGVPVASNRGLPFNGPLGPNGKPLVQPQPGSKEDLRRRKAIREERERIEGEL
jgi:hypothetical protein